ncbi:MAG: hypothetical protein II214_02490, partial [Alistipes sp.]|nr:hypothetical protein [Alistipes sp.]
MKRILSLLTVVFATLVVGCYNDATTDNTIGGDGVTSLTLTTPDTRVFLGEKDGDTYPVYWSEGDRISVNGVVSSEAEIDATNPSKAQFSFAQTLNYPLSILYPSGSSVVFPAEQEYVEG